MGGGRRQTCQVQLDPFSDGLQNGLVCTKGHPSLNVLAWAHERGSQNLQRKIGLLQIPKSASIQKIGGHKHHGWTKGHPCAIEPWTNGVCAQGVFTPALLIWQVEQIGIGLYPSPLSKAWGWDCLSSSMTESIDWAAAG